MSHNVGNGGTFGIDAYVRKKDPAMTVQPPFHFSEGESPKLPSGFLYSITDYQQQVELSPSDAALAAILILKDLAGQGHWEEIKRPSQDQLLDLKKAVEKITRWV